MSTDLPIFFGSDGLIPTVTVEASTGDVLMIGFLNEESLAMTRATGLVHYWSRSRSELWLKGRTSGHLQHVEEIRVNCDRNTLMISVRQEGAVCHDGYPTCFYRRLEDDNSLTRLRDRWFDPADVYGPTGGMHARLSEWWGSYLHLSTNNLSSVSNSSRLLHGGDGSFGTRVADEMRELAGVLDGTHVHDHPDADMRLEASQVCYWLVVSAISSGIRFEDVRPDRAIDIQPGADPAPVRTLTSLLRRSANEWENKTNATAAEIHEAFHLVASAIAASGTHPIEVVERDLAELRTRPYLAAYFDSLV